ncbi:unnamed protein product [Meganyctiphanes norvegica]|uniref:Arf-GAP domain-containing protein n=1 Tax=Meganyctiphanes norvegica TaxID=48144 RepID=A0AAV2Q6H0_MEGNR
MSTLSEREKNKAVQEKCQSILTELLKDEDNKYCVDCDAKSPRWASWNLGIFLCIRCAGIHRNLGVHISRVKSVNLDTWTPQQVACIQQMGNSRARAVYEANLPDSFRRPQMDSALEQFVRAKYEAKKYIAREWVPPPMPNPTWDLEMEKHIKKKKEKKAPGSKNTSPSPAATTSAPSTASITTTTTIPASNTSSGTLDLLGLDVPTAISTNGDTSNGDPFGEFLAAPAMGTSSISSTGNIAATPAAAQESTKNEEENFFNQKLPEGGSDKMSKDSILALFSQNQTAAPPPAAMYGVPGGVYLGQPSQVVQNGGVVPQGNMMHGVPSSTAATGIPQGGMMQQGTMQNAAMLQQQQMFMSQAVGGMAAPFFANGGVPQGVPTSIQLSAANPFAQMQNQMAGMNLGVMGGGSNPVSPGQNMMGMGVGGGMMAGMSPMAAGMQHQQAAAAVAPNLMATRPPGASNTLNTNLWH